ncbi:MAG: hypothetical protein JWN06_2765 [Propionibacteriaceae bacterium]|jgi:hypothetical protein|nr:hypothetical protein [Propionibacteriaceae bacterium]
MTVVARAPAAVYAQTDNSEWKNKIFNLIYYLLTMFAWAAYLTRPRAPLRGTVPGPNERKSP